MRLYNTSTNQIDEFKPLDSHQVTLYTCGPTVYSIAHIGNMTAYVYWDALVRILELNGHKVKRVMNITDVGHLVSDADEGEDKMEKGARLSGKTVWEVAEHFTHQFLVDFHSLNMREPSKIARATEYVEEGLNLVRILKREGYTYQIDDGIYYDTSKFPSYANFAHLDIDELKAGARVEFNQAKRNISDFALWKFVRANEKHEMQWETPEDLLLIGGKIMGYPGWHLECSAIIKAELGETIDIHTGGIDHIPVHHTNEIAQSEAANKAKLANYWLNCDFATIDGQKISKSLGNVYYLSDLVRKGFKPLDYRMWVLQGHFRSQRNFTFENLEAAKKRLLVWRNFAALRFQKLPSSTEIIASAQKKILLAASNNLNTPEAMAIVDELPTEFVPNEEFVQFLDNLFGLDLLNSAPDIDARARSLLSNRELARKERNWTESDRLRGEIEKIGFIVNDEQNGSTWGYLK